MRLRASVVGRTFITALVTALAGASVVAGPASTATASAAVRSPGVSTSSLAWAPVARAVVHPGVRTYTKGAQCTANFVFADRGGAVYLGQAAHCSGTGGPSDINGCVSGSLPLGTRVRVDGASRPGTLAYSSWIAMRRARETRPDVCDFNDFALVRVDPPDVARVNPSVPFWGGPVGVDTDGTRRGDPVVSYGNSSLRNGLAALSPKKGVSLGDTGGGWSHTVFTLTPGIPGDSGSAVLSGDGAALGVLATLQLAPIAGSNGVGDLANELAYARTHGVPGLRLVRGTERFVGSRR